MLHAAVLFIVCSIIFCFEKVFREFLDGQDFVKASIPKLPDWPKTMQHENLRHNYLKISEKTPTVLYLLQFFFMKINISNYLKPINFCIDQSKEALKIFRSFSKKKPSKSPQTICKINRRSLS